MGVAADSQFHVLAVDDSIIDRKLIERLLKTSSFQVTTVDSGSKALEFLGLHEDEEMSTNETCVESPNINQEVEVNLIITDYCMPGMTGYDLLKKVKKSSSLKDIPVVIMSSENVPSRISRCLEEGAEEFFLKPVKISDVHKLKPHMMKTKVKETGQHQHQHQHHNQEHQKHKQEHQKHKQEHQKHNQEHQEHNVLENAEVESQQQSNGNKRKSMEEGDHTIQNKAQVQWWPYCRFD